MLQTLSSSMHSNSLDLSNRGLKAFPMVRSCDDDERVPVVVLCVWSVKSCARNFLVLSCKKDKIVRVVEPFVWGIPSYDSNF